MRITERKVLLIPTAFNECVHWPFEREMTRADDYINYSKLLFKSIINLVVIFFENFWDKEKV